jgi:CheY-like chemotaxis protein/two-component sensor histidine kinase
MIEKNETLEKHNTFQRDFIDIATHQLRNPILPIVGFSKNLKSKIKDSVLVEQLDIIIRNGEKLRDIANDILDVSRIETNSLRINKDLFDLDLALSNIVLEYQNISLRESTNIKFIYYGKPGLSIKADRSLISQALYNLLNNSYFFTKENQGQEITVSLIEEENNTFVTIVVEDEGPGLPEKDFNQLFTKFYTKTTGGTGLGLFISKKLIEIHGGSIIVKNRSPDIGLKFIIRIPLTSSDSFSQSGENNTKANRILFIDDFPENLNLIKNKIEDLGYKMDYYADPLDAMEHFLPGTYSLVFLGVDIGGIDGFDLYDELKKRDNAIKGYFMTSNKINQDAIEELFDKDMIASNFIDKPISIDSVLNIVKRANNHI